MSSAEIIINREMARQNGIVQPLLTGKQIKRKVIILVRILKFFKSFIFLLFLPNILKHYYNLF